jgi:hypothetical protein
MIICDNGRHSHKQFLEFGKPYLYQKKMSSCTYISGEGKTAFGFKAIKDRFALNFHAPIYNFIETNRFRGDSNILKLLTQGNIKQQITK